MALGENGYVGFGVESVPGEAASITHYLPTVRAFTGEDTDDDMAPEYIHDSRDLTVSMPGPKSVSGTMETDLTTVDIVPLLQSAWGATATDGSAYSGGGYQFDFVPGAKVVAVTVESNSDDLLVKTYTGVRIDGLEIKAAYGELVTASWNLEGVDNLTSAEEPDSPTYTDTSPLSFTGAEVFIDGTQSATIKDVTFGVNGNHERIGVLRKTRAWSRMSHGRRDIMLSFTADFINADEVDRFDAADWFEVILNFEGDTVGTNVERLTITLPKCRYIRGGGPLQPGQLEQSLECRVLKPVGQAIFTATLISKQNSALAGRVA